MSPVVPNDFKNLIPDSTSSKCAAFVKALLQLPVKLWQLVAWLLDDDGNLTDEFKRAMQPTGTYEFAAAVLPEVGRLLCDGREISRTEYADLFAVIGTTYGSTSGSTFTLPDFQDRFPLGKSGTRALASTGDGKLVTTNLPEHSHLLAHSTVKTGTDKITADTDYIAYEGIGHAGDSNYYYSLAPSVGGAEPDVGRVGITGEADPDPVFSPYLVCLIYIRT